MFPSSATWMLCWNGVQVDHARRHASGIHSQALECSELISSGDIVCEAGCSCRDKQDRFQITDAARNHSGKLMIQGERLYEDQQ